jgi:hypothetical protein
VSADHDLLLEWASEKGAGDWQEMREAWDFITREHRREGADPAERAWVAAAGLSALAHIEIAWDGYDRWAAAPPVLTMLPHSGGRALLTGARTRALYWPSGPVPGEPSGLLHDEGERLDLWVDPIPRRGSPTAVLVACNDPGDAEALASACGIAFSYSVSDQLSAMLPSLAAAQRLWAPGPLPQGFPVEAFDPDELGWRESDEDEAARGPGLYRCKTWKAFVHVLLTGTGARLRVPREPAVYERLRWQGRSVLHYDERASELWVPSHARLPWMQERAAVLCSGQLPRPRNGPGGRSGHFYVNVQSHIAARIAASLSQELPPARHA